MIHDETRRKLRALKLDELVEYLDMHITESDKLGLSFWEMRGFRAINAEP